MPDRYRRRKALPALKLDVLWVLTVILFAVNLPTRPASAAPARVWGTRPLLSYFGLTASLEAPLRREAQLSPAEFALVRRSAEAESAALRRLLDESAPLVSNPSLTLAQKRTLIRRMAYNPRVDAIVYATDRSLRRALAPAAYTRLVAAIERLWPQEVRRHGASPGLILHLPLPSFGFPRFTNPFPLSAPRSYEIYATRYDSSGRYTAALPDQCLKLTNGGHSTCLDKGYVAGQTYSIIMRYKKSVGVDVGEAGPWNIDDNFWAGLGDPTPRRMFADLAVGMPEAQAAFYNGYNGGVDQYGRKVTAPFAIDLAFQVADDLGIPPKANDWITVSFMWTDGWGTGGGGGSGAAAFVPIETTAAAADGSIVHAVQEGQSLWAIAVAYGLTIERLRLLNGLAEDAVIVPGQKLTVHPPGPSATPPAPNALTQTAVPSAASTQAAADSTLDSSAQRTQRTERSAQHTATALALAAPLASPDAGVASRPLASPGSPAAVATLPARAPAGAQGIDLIPLLIAATALLGLALFVWGRWLSTRSASSDPDGK